MSKRPEKVLLESASLSEMRARKAHTQALLDYHWKYYSELAGQRKKIQEALFSTLVEGASGPVERNRWQRAMKLQYALHPLCVVGNLNSQAGGRFSIGKKLNHLHFPPFPAFYAAVDRETAEFELLCQENTEKQLSNYDFALTQKESIAVVSVSIRLDKCFDLRSAKPLRKFVNKIRHFTLSADLIRMAKNLGITPPNVVTTTSQLRETLLAPNWREAPMNCDVPANSQIFGQLLSESGIEGVLYPSRMTGRDSIAVFTRNLGKSDSWVKLDDQPLVEGVPIQLGGSNFQFAEMTAKELRISRPS